MTNEVNYYQFQKDLNYPVFLRFENKDLESEFQNLMTNLGFSKLETAELKSIQFDHHSTKVLRIQRANPRVAKQIDETYATDKYGPENINQLGTYDVYRYKNFGMMILSETNYIWELGVKNIEKGHNEIKTMLVRFISWTLASQGVFGVWSVPVEEGLVVMKPSESNFETSFIDVKKNIFITQDGVKTLEGGMQILRLDESLKDRSRGMSKEELISFLSTKNTFFSYRGLDFRIRQSIFDLAQIAQGVVYPVENFKPRLEMSEAS